MLGLVRPIRLRQQVNSRRSPVIRVHYRDVDTMELPTTSCWLAGRPIWALHGLLCLANCKIGPIIKLAMPSLVNQPRVILTRLPPPPAPGLWCLELLKRAQGLPIHSLLHAVVFAAGSGACHVCVDWFGRTFTVVVPSPPINCFLIQKAPKQFGAFLLPPSHVGQASSRSLDRSSSTAKNSTRPSRNPTTTP